MTDDNGDCRAVYLTLPRPGEVPELRPGETFARLIGRVQTQLDVARNAVEYLEVAKQAQALRHLAKVLNAALEAKAECLRMEVMAGMCLAEEHRLAQERGEAAKPGEQDRARDNVQATDIIPATLDELGLDRRRLTAVPSVAQSRLANDAEEHARKLLGLPPRDVVDAVVESWPAIVESTVKRMAAE